MKKGLAALIRLHTWQLDEKRRELVELERLEDQFHAEVRRLEDEVAAEQEFSQGGAKTDGLAYGAFALGIITRRKRIEASIVEVRHRIEAKRDEVAEAYRDLKRYEITQAQRQKRAREEEGRRVQAVLDEVSLNQHIRRGGP